MADKKKVVTSRDVAKLAGVSQSTVSRVFMTASSASPEAREKVLAAARQLNYRPNAFARSLTTQESKLIGLVFPDTDYPIHMETLQHISLELQRNGYSAVLIPWQINDNRHTVPDIFQYRVDGVISASAHFNSALYEECATFHIPIVQFARVESGSDCSYAISDNYGAGQHAARFFVERGAKKLAYLTGEVPTFTNTEREQGFIDESVRLTGQNPQTITASYSYCNSLAVLIKLLNSANRPDAIFCSTDLLAAALMDVARTHMNLKIPDDLQIIGFDDIPQSAWLSYQLTTFRQDFSRLAREAVKILLQEMGNRGGKLTRLMLPTTLVERGSTRSSSVAVLAPSLSTSVIVN